MNRVFISYSRRNRIFAERLARDLSDAGLDVWIDFRQIHAGELWEQEIYRGLERSDIVVVCLSPEAVASSWVQREVELAREQRKFLLPVMAVNALRELQASEPLSWMMQLQYIDFEANYEAAFPELLRALPGKRRVSVYDTVDPANVSNPFKGLEAFQQTDAAFFFGRESLVEKSLNRLRQERTARFLAVVGASGSGKSSIVRAGVLPAIRAGRLPGSAQWRIAIFTPGDRPLTSMANRLSPLMESHEASVIDEMLHETPEYFDELTRYTLEDAPKDARLLLVVDQFEEVFTRAGEVEAEKFIAVIARAVTNPLGRAYVLITMRADFFDRLTRYPELARLFEQENMVIATEMTPPELLRTIEGPAQAVGLSYDAGLPQRILEEVRRQPGSLPLLQYALKELFLRRKGLKLTIQAYEEIGGVQKALARHAEAIYQSMGAAQQSVTRRVLLRLVEVSETGEATRRTVNRTELTFRDVTDEAVQELIDKLTASDTRLLIANRQIAAKGDNTQPQTLIEVSHEALIREWDRFRDWVAENAEHLRLSSEILQAATDWQTSNKSNDYLLTGSRLTKADAWLDEGDATPLQRAFVIASMSESDQRDKLEQQRLKTQLTLQRRFLLVLVMAVLLVAGLAFLAIIAQREADSQRIVAENAEQQALFNLQRAISLSLSASANRELDDFNTDEAAKLAVNANLVNLDDTQIPEISERTLADVVYRPGPQTLISTDGLALGDVVMSADGTRAFSPAGKFIIEWDITSGEEIKRWAGTSEPLVHNGDITALAINPQRAILASGDSEGRILLWDADTGMPLRILEAHTTNVNALEFSPNGANLVSGGADGRVIWWSVDHLTEPRIYTDHNAIINDVAVNPAGNTIASAGNDRRIYVWRLSGTTGPVILNDEGGHESGVTALSFTRSIDSNLLFSGDEGGEIIVWNVAFQRIIDRMDDHQAEITEIVYGEGADNLFTADVNGVILRWNSTTRRVITGFADHDAPIAGLTVNVAANRLLSTDTSGALRVWDIQNAEDAGALLVSDSGRANNVRGFYTPDGRMIFTLGANGSLFLWDAVTGLIVQGYQDEAAHPAVPLNGGQLVDGAISADGKTALTLDSTGQMALWNVASGALIRTLNGASAHADGTIVVIRFYPDGTKAISADSNGLMVVWDLSTGEAVAWMLPSLGKNQPGHEDVVTDVAVHPSGAFVFSAGADGKLILWDGQTGEFIENYEGHNGQAVIAVAFHHTGDYALSGARDGRVILWNTSGDLRSRDARQSIIRRFDAHTQSVVDVAFSPLREQFATVSVDDTLVVWDIRNLIEGGEQSTLTAESVSEITGDETSEGQAFDIRAFSIANSLNFVTLMFSPDGETIITGMNNGTLARWQLFPFPRDLLAFIAANRTVEELNQAERDLYQIDAPLTGEGHYPAPLPIRTPLPTWNVISVGATVITNTTGGSRVNVRAEANSSAQTLFQLEDNVTVMVIDGPTFNSDLTWWQIRTADGQEGWTAASIPNIQLLVPEGAINGG